MFRDCLLGDMLTLQRGFDLPAQARCEGAIPIVSSSGVTGVHNEAKVKGPGVVTGRYGTLGEIHYVPGDFWPLNTTLYVRDFKGNEPRFVAYFLRTLDFANRSAAAAVPGINRNDLHRIPVRCPSPAKQRHIGSILSAYDNLIENNMRRIAILEEMARRIYEEWFVRFRFPGFEAMRMVESELGLVPEGWAVVPIGSVVKLLSGFAFKSSTFFEDGNFALVTIKNVHDGKFVEECASRLFHPPSNMPQHCNLNVADILLSLTGNVGRCCLVTLEGCLLNQRVAKIEPLKPFDWAYSYLLFRSTQLRERLEAIATGVAQQNLSPVESQRMQMLIPAESLRRQFSEVVTHLLRLTLTLNRASANLRTTRDLLLPKLISGELDVSALPEPEAAMA